MEKQKKNQKHYYGLCCKNDKYELFIFKTIKSRNNWSINTPLTLCIVSKHAYAIMQQNNITINRSFLNK